MLTASLRQSAIAFPEYNSPLLEVSHPSLVILFRYGQSSRRYQKGCKASGYRSSYCVYGLSHIHQYVADDGYRLMGLTGSGMSHVRDMSYIDFRVFNLV